MDSEIFARKLVRSRSLAIDLIKRGKVLVNGAMAIKPSMDVGPDDAISIAGDAAYVGRAGEKLAHALAEWRLDVRGLTIVDIGSSTGGFTDCLLRNGAAKVYAVDVGTDQLDSSLRSDSRVEVHEGIDIRKFSLPAPVDMAVIDVSFISLNKVLPKAFELVRLGGRVVALVKPQFEVGKEIADRRKGVITDPRERAEALEQTKAAALAAGFTVRAETDSPIQGEKGNKEFLILLEKAA
ncbi:MAG: TlyA family RNA methyltransferase [Patescibacteria group bacterium]|nr:TlyA family RNA methyltransferase [Patescibacteria group bacterium]